MTTSKKLTHKNERRSDFASDRPSSDLLFFEEKKGYEQEKKRGEHQQGGAPRGAVVPLDPKDQEVGKNQGQKYDPGNEKFHCHLLSAYNTTTIHNFCQLFWAFNFKMIFSISIPRSRPAIRAS